MRQTVIELPDDLDARLRDEAERRQSTVSAVTREAIEAYLSAGTRRTLKAAGVGHSGQADIAERMEELLREELLP